MITYGMQTDLHWQKGMIELLNLDMYDFKILNGMKNYITNIEILQNEKEVRKNMHWQDGMYDMRYDA